MVDELGVVVQLRQQVLLLLQSQCTLERLHHQLLGLDSCAVPDAGRHVQRDLVLSGTHHVQPHHLCSLAFLFEVPNVFIEGDYKMLIHFCLLLIAINVIHVPNSVTNCIEFNK